MLCLILFKNRNYCQNYSVRKYVSIPFLLFYIDKYTNNLKQITNTMDKCINSKHKRKNYFSKKQYLWQSANTNYLSKIVPKQLNYVLRLIHNLHK